MSEQVSTEGFIAFDAGSIPVEGFIDYLPPPPPPTPTITVNNVQAALDRLCEQFRSKT